MNSEDCQQTYDFLHCRQMLVVRFLLLQITEYHVQIKTPQIVRWQAEQI